AMSISSASTPAWMAYSKAGTVFSGRTPRAPRCPCTRILRGSAACDITLVTHRMASSLNISRVLAFNAIHVFHRQQIQTNHVTCLDELRDHHIDTVFKLCGLECAIG